MAESAKAAVDRRNFLKSAAAGAAVLVATSPGTTQAQRSKEAAGASASAAPGEADIVKMKERIALATRLLASEGIVGSSGHVSMRIPGTDRVLVGPSDVSRDVITAQDVVLVDLDSKQLEGNRKRPDETEIHTGIYRARADVMSIVHTHPTYSVVFPSPKSRSCRCICTGRSLPMACRYSIALGTSTRGNWAMGWRGARQPARCADQDARGGDCGALA